MALPEFVTPQEVAVLSPGIEVERAAVLIRAVTARAVAVAPCLAGDRLSEAQRAAVGAVILDAVTRWAATGGGQAADLASGPFRFSTDNRQERRGAFLRSEFDDLQAICDAVTGVQQGAFSISLTSATRRHASRPLRPLTWDAAFERGWVE